MVRSSVKLTYTEDSKARRSTYGKRSKCVLKKTRELSTLCDVQACSIIYGPYSTTPEVSPSVEGAREVLTRFRNMPEYQQGVRRANQEILTNELIRRQEEKLARQRMLNYRNDMTRFMYKRMKGEGTCKVSLEDLLEMGLICDEKVKEVDERLEKMKLEGDVNGMGPRNGLMADPNSLSDRPTDMTGGYVGLPDELLELYHNLSLFPNTNDGAFVRPSNNNP